jgi:hypothetical protein
MRQLYVRALYTLAVCGVMGVSSVAAAQEHEIRSHTCQTVSGGVTVYINGGTRATDAAKKHKVGEVKQLSGGWSGKVVEVGEFTSKVLVADEAAKCVNLNLAAKPAPTPAPTPAPNKTDKQLCDELVAEKKAEGFYTYKKGTSKACDGNPSKQELRVTSNKSPTAKLVSCNIIACDPSLRGH